MEHAIAPVVRCYPKSDGDFERNVAALLTAEECTAAQVEALLRSMYPNVRIVAQIDLANLDGREVWYCYRDGRVVVRPDGPGAMRLWLPIEVQSERTLDLMEASADAILGAFDALERAWNARRRSRALRQARTAVTR